MFDPPISPRQLLPELGLNVSALTFYYLTALCIGYYCGYLLVVFGKTPVPTRRDPHPETALPQPVLWLCPVIVAAGAGLVGALGGLVALSKCAHHSRGQ